MHVIAWPTGLSTPTASGRRVRDDSGRANPRVRDVTIQLMDHVGVVVDDLEAAISVFVELGMELDGGTTPVEGDWVDRVVGLDEVRVEIAFVRPPAGRSRWPPTASLGRLAEAIESVTTAH